jgi:hypothetical protein
MLGLKDFADSITAQSRSRQIPIPGSNAIDENLLYDLANTLLRQVEAGHIYQLRRYGAISQLGQVS